MISVAVGVIDALILAIIIMINKRQGHHSWFGRFERCLAILLSAIFIVIIEFTAWDAYTGFATDVKKTTEIVVSRNLMALQDSTFTTGAFFLVCEDLGAESRYNFRCETEDGFKYETLPANSKQCPVYIKYIPEGAIPHIDQYSIVEKRVVSIDTGDSWKYSIIAWFQCRQLRPGDIVSTKITNPSPVKALYTVGYYDNWRFEIYIPEGAIKSDDTIDLE